MAVEAQVARAHTRTCVHTHTHMHMRTYTCTHAHTCVHTHAHMCKHAHVCTHAYAHMYTCTRAHVYTCTHVYTHAHTCTHARAQPSHTDVHRQPALPVQCLLPSISQELLKVSLLDKTFLIFLKRKEKTITIYRVSLTHCGPDRGNCLEAFVLKSKVSLTPFLEMRKLNQGP